MCTSVSRVAVLGKVVREGHSTKRGWTMWTPEKEL